MNNDSYQVELSQMTPLGIRQQTYNDAVILCDDNKAVLVFVENDTEKFNMTIKAGIAGKNNTLSTAA